MIVNFVTQWLLGHSTRRNRNLHDLEKCRTHLEVQCYSSCLVIEDANNGGLTKDENNSCSALVRLFIEQIQLLRGRLVAVSVWREICLPL